MTLQEYNDLYKLPMLKSMKIVSSGGVTITNANIVSEQMSLEKSLCSDANLRFGRCEAACFKVRVADIIHDFTGEWLTVTQDAKADVEGYLLAQDGKYLLTQDGQKIKLRTQKEYESLADFGRFKVYSEKPDNDRRWKTLTCYDAMKDILSADVLSWYNGLTFPMTIKNFRDSLFSYLGITQVTTTLINDNLSIIKGFSADGTLSGKVVIESICELNGVFGQITSDGKFNYVSLPGADSLTYDYYVDGTGSYEDYTTATITGLKVISSDDDAGVIVGNTDNLYVIDSNPLIYGLEGTQALTTALNALLTKISTVSYRPFSIQTYGIPQLPLGTVITLNTRNKTIVSYVINSNMTGIQSLRQTISAKGDKVQPTEVNSMDSRIMRQAGKMHKLINDVDRMTSEISDLNGNVSTLSQTVDGFSVRISGAETKADAAMAATIASDTIHLLATDSNVEPSLNDPNWDVVTEISALNKYLWSYHEYTYGDGHTSHTDPVITGRWGDSSSSSSIQYTMVVSAAAIAKNGSGTYTPSSITLTGMFQTGTTAPSSYSGRFKIETTANGSSWTTQYTSSTDEATKTYTIPTGITAVRCTLYYAGGTTTVLDQQTIPVVVSGVDGYSIILTNENHTFAGSETAALASSTDCNIIAYHGATQVAATIGTITGQPTGMTTTISNNGTTSAKFTVTVTTSMVTKNGVLTVPVTADGKTFNMKFTYSLSLKGSTGATGATGPKGDKGDKGDTGSAGANARVYELRISNAAIGKSTAGVYNPSAISIQAKAQEGSSSPGDYSGRFRIETTTDNVTWTAQYISSSDEYYKSYTVPTNIAGLKAIKCLLYRAGSTTDLLDYQTIPIVTDGAKGDKGDTGATGATGPAGADGKDAYTVILTNENYTFLGTTTAAYADIVDCPVIAYKGATQVGATIGTITGQPTGMTTSISGNGTTYAKFTVTVDTTMTTKRGILNVPVTVDGKTFNMKFSYTLALKGDTGDTGTGITEVITLRYASSSYNVPSAPTSPVSSTSTSANQWTKAIPDLDETNKYLYTCDQIHYNKSSVGNNGYVWTTVVEDKAFSDVMFDVNKANNAIVLKATSSGRIVKVALKNDASTGTSFSVLADDISMTASQAIHFMSGGTINLSSETIAIDTANHVFQVTSAGAVTCSNLTVNGGSINLGSGVFTVNNNGAVTCSNLTVSGGSINLGNGNFKVTSAGAVTCHNINADGGKIGDWTIDSTGLTKTIGNNVASIYPTSISVCNTESGTTISPYAVFTGRLETLELHCGHIVTEDPYKQEFNIDADGNVDTRGTLTAKKVNGCIFKAGTKIVTATGGTSTAVFTNAQLNTLLGVTGSTNGNTIVLASNGDGGAQSAHAEGCTYQNDTWYVTHDRNTTAGNMRINYLVFYWG